MAAVTVSLSNSFSVFIKFYCVPTFELVDNKFTSYLPKNSVYLIEQWVKDLDVDIRVVKPRKSKLGDFRCNLNRKYIISINNNLNQFSFLITLIHELLMLLFMKNTERMFWLMVMSGKKCLEN